MRVAALVEIYQRFIDFAVLLCEGNLLANRIIRHLQMTNFTFEFLKVIGDVFGGPEFMSE